MKYNKKKINKLKILLIKKKIYFNNFFRILKLFLKISHNKIKLSFIKKLYNNKKYNNNKFNKNK
jgi:hypothetical protein